MKPAPSLANRVDVMFRAFSDRTRLRILYLLQGGECCVGDIVEALQIEQPSASRHLAYLRRAGLVVVRKAGHWSYYSLAPAEQDFHRKLLECLACCFSQVPEIQNDQARRQRLEQQGGCCPEKGPARPTETLSEGSQPGPCCPRSS